MRRVYITLVYTLELMKLGSDCVDAYKLLCKNGRGKRLLPLFEGSKLKAKTLGK